VRLLHALGAPPGNPGLLAGPPGPAQPPAAPESAAAGRPTAGQPGRSRLPSFPGTTDGLISVAFPAADSLALADGTYWAEAKATDALSLPRLVAWGPWLHHDTGLGGVS
jgi:hypothetical protein